MSLTIDNDPANRVGDRLLAAFGLLDDAAPIFGDAQAVPGAGMPEVYAVVASNCLAHGGRHVVDEVENLPDECRHLLEAPAE